MSVPESLQTSDVLLELLQELLQELRLKISRQSKGEEPEHHLLVARRWMSAPSERFRGQWRSTEAAGFIQKNFINCWFSADTRLALKSDSFDLFNTWITGNQMHSCAPVPTRGQTPQVHDISEDESRSRAAACLKHLSLKHFPERTFWHNWCFVEVLVPFSTPNWTVLTSNRDFYKISAKMTTLLISPNQIKIFDIKSLILCHKIVKLWIVKLQRYVEDMWILQNCNFTSENSKFCHKFHNIYIFFHQKLIWTKNLKFLKIQTFCCKIIKYNKFWLFDKNSKLFLIKLRLLRNSCFMGKIFCKM